jgi:prevent-host-death family protein
MAQVGNRALKQNASAVVAEAAAGDIVTITDRGRPVAILVPLTSSRVDALVVSDQARPARGRLRDLPAPARRRHGARSLSHELMDMRESERY